MHSRQQVGRCTHFNLHDCRGHHDNFAFAHDWLLLAMCVCFGVVLSCFRSEKPPTENRKNYLREKPLSFSFVFQSSVYFTARVCLCFVVCCRFLTFSTLCASTTAGRQSCLWSAQQEEVSLYMRHTSSRLRSIIYPAVLSCPSCKQQLLLMGSIPHRKRKNIAKKPGTKTKYLHFLVELCNQ